ncbi:hypothetical protein LAV73_06705 [Lysinibacillus xylanilyticus]|uniref:hypothetical protein n=1 Tax=Lysinibacillus xylanilyticus TaxID=582475 RepID=UPI002B2471BD|nr:hypothetical protein [Lysinibacillus xylanilyticus]MEB2279690.1 hypothetical protein [Lysinibacillus xylanilyticus]
MDREEAKAKRKELGLQERRLVEMHCANCPVKGQDVTACEGCPIFNKITGIGEKYIAVTRKYRRVNKIKGIDNSVIAPIEPRVKTATALAWIEWKQIAKEHGISRDTFNARVKTGMSPEDAATRSTRRRRFTDEQIAIALKNGIAYGTLITRTKIGWSIEDSISVPVNKKPSKRGCC